MTFHCQVWWATWATRLPWHRNRLVLSTDRTSISARFRSILGMSFDSLRMTYDQWSFGKIMGRFQIKRPKWSQSESWKPPAKGSHANVREVPAKGDVTRMALRVFWMQCDKPKNYYVYAWFPRAIPHLGLLVFGNVAMSWQCMNPGKDDCWHLLTQKWLQHAAAPSIVRFCSPRARGKKKYSRLHTIMTYHDHAATLR